MRFPKVLVFSPTYEGKEYCRKEFVENINKLSYPNFDFIMIDNTAGNEYYEKLKVRDLEFAEKYTYLDLSMSETNRAANYEEMKEAVEWASE